MLCYVGACLPVVYREHRPAAPLDQFVESYWYCAEYTAPHRWERRLPSRNFQFVIQLAGDHFRQWAPGGQTAASDETLAPGALAVGVHSRYQVIDTADLRGLMGVVFRPGGAGAFLPVPLDEFHNQEIALADLWPAALVNQWRSRLREAPSPDAKFAVLSELLLAQWRREFVVHPAVSGALRLEPNGRVAAWSELTGLSRRRFSQLFREQIGLTPKLYLRLCRFQQVVQDLHAGQDVEWCDIALAGGYADQAHLAHEFREFSGFTISDYSAQTRPWANHVVVGD